MNLVWLRRDLRLYDHAALHAAARLGRVQPVFVFDSAVLARFKNPRDRRLSFLMRTLAHMHVQLQVHGAGILVLHGRAVELVPKLKHRLQALSIHAAQDYEPPAIARDTALKDIVQFHKDQVIYAPDEIKNQSGAEFKVYTPFSKAWRAKLSPLSTAEFPTPTPAQYATFADTLNLAQGLPLLDVTKADESLKLLGYEAVEEPLWSVHDARQKLQSFTKERGSAYANARDMLALDGTSRLSPYLRFGLISVREAVQLALNHNADKWLSELIWREFYAMILFHAPHSPTQEWNPQYRTLPWREDAQQLARWKEGKTGFPVVDAAMRQLLAEGWMHNRARMIVASFLTKDLQINWRLGEEHFAQYLMDYDMASNVGGWQWAASTGTDAQPYFRIFNPYLQSRRFDPEGAYIRRFVPELVHVFGDVIHEPPNMACYPPPMVDHRAEKERALMMFKSV